MGRLVKTTPAVQEQQEEKRTVVGTGVNGRLVKTGDVQSTSPAANAVKTTPVTQQKATQKGGYSPMFRQQQNVVAPKNQSALAQNLGKGALQQKEAKNYQSESAFNQHVQDVKPQTVAQRAGNTIKGATKTYGGSLVNLTGLAQSGTNIRMRKEAEAEVADWDREIAAQQALLRDPTRSDGDKESARNVIMALEAKKSAYLKAYGVGGEADKTADAIYQAADKLTDSGTKDINKAKSGLGKVGQLAVDVGVAGAQMGADAALGLLTGGSALPAMFVRSTGGSAQQARREGATHEQQVNYGFASGALSVATEKIGNAAAPFKKIFGKGFLDDVIERAMGNLTKSAAGKIALSFLEEGGEEAIEDLIQPALQMIYNGKTLGGSYSELEAAEVLNDFLVGGILGGLGGGVEVATNRFARFDNSLGESGRKAIRGSYQEGKDTAQHVADFLPAYNAGVEGKANPNPTNETAYAGYSAGQNDAKAVAGTGEHIDSRTKENVSGRNVNAFQFDHPELHSYYSAAAEQIAGIADISLSRGQQKGARQRTANGYQRSNQIFETPAMRKAMDEGLTRTQIIDAAQRIINDNGQENVKAAKTLEIVLDDMLTNGYTAVDGTAVAPNTDYIAAKQQIAGAEVQATGFDKYVSDNRLALETGEVTMDELRAEYAQQEGAEHGEAVHLRDGSERDNGADPRGEVRGVEESTGRDQSRKEGRHFADGEAAALDYGEKVSTASFGIGRGAVNDSVYLVKNETAEMRKAKDLAKKRGLRVTFFAGNNLTFRDKSGKAFQVRGYVSGDRVFIRADHPEFTSYQIMRHEAGHDMIAKGEVDLNEVRTRIDKTFTSGEVGSLCTAYADAYAGTEMTAQEIWEEVVCDSLGDMNIFADSEISDAAAFILAHIKVESETIAQESSRAPPSGTGPVREKFSIEKTTDNKSFVEVDEDILDGIPQKDWVSTVKENLKNKFPDGITVGNNEINIDYQSRQEMTFSRYMQWLYNNDPKLREDKLRATNNADEILLATTDWVNEGLNHPRKDKIADFARGNVLLRVGGNDYTAEVVVGTRESGSMLLYDILNLQPTSFVEKETDAVKAENPSPGTNRNTASVSESSVPQNGRNVNSVDDAKFSREIPEANYETLKEKYGYIPAGERAYREVQVPKKTADDKYVSRTIRTVLEAKATPDAMVPTLERMVAKGEFSYDRYTDKQAISGAESRIKTEGWQKTLNKWENSTKDGISKENTAIGWALYNNAANSGDVETAIDVLDTIVKRQRNAAQALQATRLLKQQDPGTQLYAAQRSVENLTEDLKKQYGEKAPDLKIDRDLAEKFLNAKDDDARTEAMKEIYRDIGRQMPSRFIDKWNAWRYLSMLGNPRTHVRNIVGNVGFVPAVTVKNVIGAGIESAANAVSGGKVGRTKAILTTKDAGLIKAAWSDYANIREQALGSGKYNDNVNVRQEIEEGRTVFKLKPLEAMRKFNGTALDAEDAWFSKPHYASALAQFCKANGITAEQVAGGKGIETAREYAIREAQKATYRDTNAFSQMISDLGRYRGDNKMKRLGSTLTEGILPFRKTPANILVRGVEYSPIGFLKSISYDLAQVQKGNMQATEMIDRAAAGLTGTGLMMLGLYMAKEGILRGSGGDDEKKKKFDELQGHQDYALELPNGTSITLDWLAPEALPFFVGANLYEQMQANNGYLTMSDMLQAASNVTDPLLSMSCLQSLNDVFDAVGYASSGDTNALTSAVASAATSYLTQGIPTVFGQAERTGESTRMTTYTDKNKFLTSDMQYALGKSSARIPGVDYGQIPFIDAWGRTESSGGVGERAFNNFVNPAYTSKVSGSKMEDELSRLYEATGETKVLPQRAPKSFTVNKENKQLTGDEYVKYATKRGQTSYKIISELTGLARYKAMSDGDKADAVAKAYEYANAVGKMSVSNYQTDGWVAKAIETVKKTGVSEAQYIALYLAKGDIESLKDRDGDTISNSEGLQIMEIVYQQKGLSDKQRAALFEDFGVGKSIRHYNKALVEEKLRKMRGGKN